MKGFERLDFDKLDLDTKSILLYYNGQVIANMRYYNYKVTLYALGKDLIEQYYDTETHDITRITTVQEQELKKYLMMIDISDLYQKI